jgi:hypothetical protein
MEMYDALQVRVEQAEMESADFSAQYFAEVDRTTELQVRVDNLLDGIRAANDEAGRLTNTNEEYLSRIAEAQARISEMQLLLEIGCDCDDAWDNLRIAEEQISDLQRQLNESQTELGKRNAEVARLKREWRDLYDRSNKEGRRTQTLFQQIAWRRCGECVHVEESGDGELPGCNRYEEADLCDECRHWESEARAELSDAITDAAHLQRERDDARAEVEALKGEKLEVHRAHEAVQADNRKLREGIEKACRKHSDDCRCGMCRILPDLLDDPKGREEPKRSCRGAVGCSGCKWAGDCPQQPPESPTSNDCECSPEWPCMDCEKCEAGPPTSDALVRAREFLRRSAELSGLTAPPRGEIVDLRICVRQLIDYLEAAEKGTK